MTIKSIPSGEISLAERWIMKFASINWRGLSAVIGFFLVWQLAVIFEFAGFQEIPSPWQVINTFFRTFCSVINIGFPGLSALSGFLSGFYWLR